ncbi:MAG: hypothetical protein P4M13_03965, partial [Alphaproteobacteria bacterium]|nr:hypothetical protein [Alphaproteobacteria bacterium]
RLLDPPAFFLADLLPFHRHLRSGCGFRESHFHPFVNPLRFSVFGDWYHTENFMSGFNPRSIKVDLIYNAGKPDWKKEITPKGIIYTGGIPPRLWVRVENNSDSNIKWVNVDLAHLGFLTMTSYGVLTDTHRLQMVPRTLNIVDLLAHRKTEQSVDPSWVYRGGRMPIISRVYGELSSGLKFDDVRKHIDYKKCYNKDTCCFVTTAAYGDPKHPMVCEFRGLRDEVLVNFKIGRRFKNWYNEKGPKMASALEQHAALKPISRAVLTPLAQTVKCARKLIDSHPSLRSFFYDRQP